MLVLDSFVTMWKLPISSSPSKCQDAAPPYVLDLDPLDPRQPPAKSPGNLRKKTEKDCEWKSIKEIPYMCVCKYMYVCMYIYTDTFYLFIYYLFIYFIYSFIYLSICLFI
jgi:hypothetical protein